MCIIYINVKISSFKAVDIIKISKHFVMKLMLPYEIFNSK